MYIFLSLNFWLALIIIFILRSLFRLYSLHKRMPPGPTPLPLLGNLLHFRGAKVGTHETTLSLQKKYGDPMTIFFGHIPSVFISKYDLAKDILQQPQFSSRPQNAVFKLILKNSQDIAFGQYGPLWQWQKKLASKIMRAIVDSEKLENQVAWAMDYTLEQMLKKSGEIDPKIYIRNSVYNVIALFAFGKTYRIEEPEFIQLYEINDRANREFTEGVVFNFIPFADYLPLTKLSGSVRRTVDSMNFYLDYVKGHIEEHRRTFQAGDMRDFCDGLIEEQQQLRASSPEENAQLDDDNMAWIILDFFSAGTDTTSAVLMWLFLYMALHPEIQEECYKAIKQVIGDREPRLSDRAKLPLVEAVMKETLRLRPAAAMGLPHGLTSDGKIGDYFVPKDAMVFANLYAMHVDPAYWEKPLEFDPRLHFIDENGEVKKPPSFVPFGYGRRVCLGEQLAKNDLFLMTTRLLQKVRLEKIPGRQYTTDCDLSVDLLMAAKPFAVSVKPRN